jgi:sporulation related protein
VRSSEKYFRDNMGKAMNSNGILKASTVRRGHTRAARILGLSCLALSGVAGAQTARDSSLYSQAQQMVANGDAVRGRKLADSVAAAAPSGSAAFAEGLYWRATLAANARDSEHEYRQIIVDYPLSARVPDALLRIGQLEASRGENAAALQHFQRLVLEHPQSPLRAEASYWVARMYFASNDATHGCAANADALASVQASNVELKNRIDFQQQSCRGVAIASNTIPSMAASTTASTASRSSANTAAAPVTVPVNPPSKATPSKATSSRPTPAKSVPPESTASPAPQADASRAPTDEEVARALASAHQPQVAARAAAQAAKHAKANAAKANAAKAAQSETSPPATTTAGTSATPASPAAPADESPSAAASYAVQVAAFSAKAPATQLVAKLRGRGYQAYVDGASAPYRVRIGHYPSHAAAAAELARLKAKHIDGFVAER